MAILSQVQLTVYDDPAKILAGPIVAELTDDGLNLKDEYSPYERQTNRLVPKGDAARRTGGHFLQLRLKDRLVTFGVTHPHLDQVRLAGDLALWVQNKKFRLDDADYQLPKYLWAFAIPPAVASVAGCVEIIRETGTTAQTVGLVAAILAGFVAAFLILVWSFAGRPEPWMRIAVFMLLTFLVFAGIAAAWTAKAGVLIDTLALVPGGPGSAFPESSWAKFSDPHHRFSVEIPGSVRSAVVKSAGGLFTVHGFESLFCGYAIVSGDLRDVVKDRMLTDRQLLAFANKAIPQAELARMRNEREINHQGIAGREFEIQLPREKSWVVRQFVWNGRLIMLMTSGPRYTTQTPDVQRFFRSLAITGARAE